ncbi:MAG: nucleotide sugar dehydrogenase [Ilumatobacter sp.]|nr:nucleotide sugar dehydrogenase [Ilumatobacter sp.]
MIVAVVGLGKIGLPLAVQAATRGLTAIGADISTDTVDLVNRGEEPFPGETDLGTKLKDVVDRGTLSATSDTAAAVRESDAVIVVVPLVVDADADADFGALDAATADIGRGLTAGTLVSYETTLPVGTTRNRFVPALEAASGLTCGEDFFVVFSPERVYSGRIFRDLRRYPKLVGGVDAASTARGIEFYEAMLEFDERPDLSTPNGVWDMGSAEAAEFAKLAETTYRDVNIGLANEFARFADTAGIDVVRVIEASNSQPFSHIHQPGIAVGGHCIPVYPRFYLANHPDARVPAAARTANAEMPDYAVSRLESVIGSLNGEKVVVLGACYRGGVKETAFSGVFATVDALAARGAHPVVHDPLFSDDELRALGFEPHELGTACDAAVIQADHPEYTTLTPADLPGCRAILDGRRCLSTSPEFALESIPVVLLGG